MPANPCRARAASGLVAAVIAASMPALAADPPAGRGGGLVPGASAPPASLTREELLRAWDLDGNGSISKSEADIARARMRRTRLEMQLGAGIDPVTGLPRGIDGGAETSGGETAAEPLFQLPPDAPASEPSRAKPESLPGLSAPGPQLPPAGGLPTARPPAAASPRGPSAAATPPTPLSARASWLPPQRLAPATTGGVRAGAPAAVPGYGTGAWRDLNAGRRPTSLEPPADGTASGSPSPSGGLLPSVRQPGRTGAIILPTLPGRQPGTGVPGLPPPPVAGGRSPRVTADEIGTERP